MSSSLPSKLSCIDFRHYSSSFVSFVSFWDKVRTFRDSSLRRYFTNTTNLWRKYTKLRSDEFVTSVSDSSFLESLLRKSDHLKSTIRSFRSHPFRRVSPTSPEGPPSFSYSKSTTEHLLPSYVSCILKTRGREIGLHLNKNGRKYIVRRNTLLRTCFFRRSIR